MDKKELEYLTYDSGKQHLMFALDASDEFRVKVTKLLFEENDNSYFIVIFLEKIIAWSSGLYKMTTTEIDNCCSYIKDVDFDKIKADRISVFRALYKRLPTLYHFMVPMFALIDFDELKDPAKVCNMVNALADMRALSMEVIAHQNEFPHDDTTTVISSMDHTTIDTSSSDEIFDEDAAYSEEAISEFLTKEMKLKF